jgi:hypothetical protein
MKTCSRCREQKEESFFCRTARGLKSHCKACQQEYSRAWREANRERCSEKRRASYLANQTAELAAAAAYRISQDPQKKSEYNKKYYQLHKDKANQVSRDYYAATRPKRIEAQKCRYQLRRAELIAYACELSRAASRTLTDSYLQKVLRMPEAPSQLIEAKREHLRLVRLIKEMTNEKPE